jgi:hypothetical protein
LIAEMFRLQSQFLSDLPPAHAGSLHTGDILRPDARNPGKASSGTADASPCACAMFPAESMMIKLKRIGVHISNARLISAAVFIISSSYSVRSVCWPIHLP